MHREGFSNSHLVLIHISILVCVSVSGQPWDGGWGSFQTPLHLRAGKHHIQWCTARRMAALQTNPHREGQGRKKFDPNTNKVQQHLHESLSRASSLVHRRWAAACGRGSGSSPFSAPIRCSFTRIRGRRCSAGPLSEVQLRTSSQSASGAAWWTLRTARPNGSTPCGWPHRTSVSTCCRRRTGRTCWTG